MLIAKGTINFKEKTIDWMIVLSVMLIFFTVAIIAYYIKMAGVEMENRVIIIGAALSAAIELWSKILSYFRYAVTAGTVGNGRRWNQRSM